MNLRACALAALFLIGYAGPSRAAGEVARAGDPFEPLAAEYDAAVRPLLAAYCNDCHATAEPEGQLDLEQYADLAAIRRRAQPWVKVAQMLQSGEMPPKDAEQPDAAERQRLEDWVARYLAAEAAATAGDPGPVVLRRLNNAEYTYTVRDLTGIDLNPAAEFPADGAAGEGFTNAGGALSMSPALVSKYLDAAKGIAAHAVPLPDGIRFSPSTTPSDWTQESLAAIRRFYSRFAADGSGTQVNLQGVVFDTNSGGRLPIETYLAAAVEERDALLSGEKSIAQLAEARGLNAKYLGILWEALASDGPSPLMGPIREAWRTAKADDASAALSMIQQWQAALWRFSSVGHIGKVGGPKGWQEAATPLASRQELRVKLNPAPGRSDVVLYLLTADAGDGGTGDIAVWERPRIVAPGRPELLLADMRDYVRATSARRQTVFAETARTLDAIAAASTDETFPDAGALAAHAGVSESTVESWLSYLGIGASAPLELFTNKLQTQAGYNFVQGWGSNGTPSLVANSSDQHVRIPGNMKPHGVAVHPAPALAVGAGWRSPVEANVTVSAQVTHAHPECGNGVTWWLELRRGATRQQLASGIAHGGQPVPLGILPAVAVRPDDMISLLIGPRDGNHSCDLTDVELTLTTDEATPRTWSLTQDVSPDVLAGNPHADRLGHDAVWHFYTEPIGESSRGVNIPAGSLLARWQATNDSPERSEVANSIQRLLQEGPPADLAGDHADRQLHRQLSSLAGPLLAGGWKPGDVPVDATAVSSIAIGLDPGMFGRTSDGAAIDAASLCVQAPHMLEVRIPRELAADAEFVATGTLHSSAGGDGSVQFQVLTSAPQRTSGLLLPAAITTTGSGPWTANNQGVAHEIPVIVHDEGAARARMQQAFDEFRGVFPIALCYTKIVPVDEVVTLTLYYREDDQLRKLMLDDAQAAELDRLWNELHFVSRDALTLVDAFAQLMEYATQDADPSVFEPMRGPIMDRAAAFRGELVAAEPPQVQAVLDFANRAWRRTLRDGEAAELRALYENLRAEKLPHDDALRLLLARVLISPAFLYRLEDSPPGDKQSPVTGDELASRLSYFLWSSQPDDELRRAAAAGTLHDDATLRAQLQRMLRSDKTRRLATEFACQWLQIYEFDQLDEKSERHFPEFQDARGPMYEEAIRFFTDLFQSNRPVSSLLDADHTFVNGALAAHYGIDQPSDSDWQRVENLRDAGRGGILGLSAILAKQSGASRTSPILRGNWVSEVLLGERLPRPPPGVPQLPEDESATAGLTVRELVEQHSSNEKCAVCHRRIDPFGFALEGYDTIGRRRTTDLGGRPIDVATTTSDGHELHGLEGLRDYLLTTRRTDFTRQFCKKLLGYALGRSVQLSDEPLLTEIERRLEEDPRVGTVFEAIVLSRQFQDIRGRDAVYPDDMLAAEHEGQETP